MIRAAVAFVLLANLDGRLLVALERADAGNAGTFVAGFLAPVDAPLARLTVDIYRGAEGTKWLVGPKALYELDHVRLELVRLAQDPASIVRRADGTRGPMSIVLQTHPKVTNAEVAATWDVAIVAGFDRVSCPPIEAWVRAEHARGR